MNVDRDEVWPIPEDAWPDDLPELGGDWTNHWGHCPTPKTGMPPTGSI